MWHAIKRLYLVYKCKCMNIWEWMGQLELHVKGTTRALERRGMFIFYTKHTIAQQSCDNANEPANVVKFLIH